MKSKSNDLPIALFDSGAGGIGVLREVKKLLPREQLLYFGDTKNAPYGEKTPTQIRALVLAAAERLIPHVKALVLACNTATAVAAAELRARHPTTPIIGMEPALRPALDVCDTPTVAVLATEATLRAQKFDNLCEMYQKNATVWRISAPRIVRLVEQGLAESPEMEAYLHSLFDPLPRLPDAVVLGCTHFPFARNAIRRVVGSVPLFDGAAGTARELCRRLTENELLASDSARGGVILHSSLPTSIPLLARLFARV